MATREKRTGEVFLLDPLKIKEEEGFNIRTDYGDLEELAQSILENGVVKPLQGCRLKDDLDGFQYRPTDGHRRLAAVKLLIERGHFSNSVDRPDDSDNEGKIFVPFLFENRSVSDETRILRMMLSADGKDLNPLERAEGCLRLQSYGYTEKEIAKKLAKSEVYVMNLLRLAGAPKKFKNLVSGNVISGTLAMSLIRENDNFDEIVTLVETAQNSSGDTPKPKVTKKDIKAVSEKFNSLKEFQKCMRENEENTPHSHMKEVIKLLEDCLEGKLSKRDFHIMFFQDPNQTEIPTD